VACSTRCNTNPGSYIGLGLPGIIAVRCLGTLSRTLVDRWLTHITGSNGLSLINELPTG
jgi:hypothetical protein